MHIGAKDRLLNVTVLVEETSYRKVGGNALVTAMTATLHHVPYCRGVRICFPAYSCYKGMKVKGNCGYSKDEVKDFHRLKSKRFC